MRATPISPGRRRAARWLARSALVLLVIGGGSGAAALPQPQQPHELVSSVVSRVMLRLHEQGAGEGNAQAELHELFEQELSPHFAFEMIVRWIAGKAWDGMSELERSELLGAVREHIVHVYAALLARGREVAISVEPSSTIGTRSARVAGLMATPDGRDFKLEFRLLLSEDSWKLYDLAVDGLSFARSLRAELNPVIGAGGVAGLKAYLREHR